jgi:selenocysteine-specific elongation factor
VALELAGRGASEVGPGEALVSPNGFVPTRLVDVRLTGEGRLPERPLLHIGASSMSVRARPLDERHVRLALGDSLPLRLGDRGLLRDPGRRVVWGVEVLDPAPPDLRRRGAAAARARSLELHDPTLAGQVRARGLVRRSFLRRIGVDVRGGAELVGGLPAGTVEVGDWLISREHAERLRSRVAELVKASSDPSGPTAEAVARALGLDDPALVTAVVHPPLRVVDGRVRSGVDALSAELATALETLRRELSQDPFAAPHADRLSELGLDSGTLARLHRRGDVLRVGENVVLLPGADEVAVRRLEALAEPFTASAARVAWGTSRRVALALLTHLDRTGRTVRLADDSRRLRHR